MTQNLKYDQPGKPVSMVWPFLSRSVYYGDTMNWWLFVNEAGDPLSALFSSYIRASIGYSLLISLYGDGYKS